MPYEGKYKVDGSTTISVVLEKMLASKQSAINTDELSYEFMKQIGGSEGFVKCVLDDYKNAIPGSPERARMMALVMQLVSMVHASTVPKDLDGVSEDDLVSYAKGLMVDCGVQGILEQGWCYDVCI